MNIKIRSILIFSIVAINFHITVLQGQSFTFISDRVSATDGNIAEEDISSGPSGRVETSGSSSSDLELTSDIQENKQQVVGIRFPNVGVPMGAIITDAFIQFVADEEQSGDVNITIKGESTSNASLFQESVGNVTSRAVTKAFVDWNPDDWSIGQSDTAQRTPNLSSIVKEIIDMPNWKSGNGMSFIMTSGDLKNLRTAENGTANGPVLTIVFQITTITFVSSRVSATDGNIAEEDISSGSPGPVETLLSSSSDIELTSDIQENKQQVVGIRFPNVGVPMGAIITDAFIQFVADEEQSGDVNITIKGESTSNASLFQESIGNITNRATTNAFVDWTPDDWSPGHSGAAQRTPDLSPIIKEIIGQPNWKPGNAMCFNVTSDELQNHRTAENKLSNGPTLTIQYTEIERSSDVNVQIEHIWSGAVTTDSAVVACKINGNADNVSLIVSEKSELHDPVFESQSQIADIITNDRRLKFKATGLSPNTVYNYGIKINGIIDFTKLGKFKTFPDPADGPYSIKFVFSGDAKFRSNHFVFNLINNEKPDIFLNLGDFHYGDEFNNDGVRLPNSKQGNMSIEEYRNDFDTTLAQSNQANLYRNVGIVRIWDDHDYGINNGDRMHIGKDSAIAEYKENNPHYPIENKGLDGIYQTFDAGRVRFIIWDTRSQRSPNLEPDNTDKTMLGARQKEWFRDQLERARSDDVPLLIIVNPSPWIANKEDGFLADNWGGFTTERMEISKEIRRLFPNKVSDEEREIIMWSADSHIIAANNTGSHADYSSSITWASSRSQAKEGNIAEEDISDGLPGSVGVFSSDLELTSDPKASNIEDTAQLIGIRFHDIRVPPGANIRSAFIQFIADEDQSGEVTIVLHGESSDNAQPFNNINVSARPVTATSVDWNPEDWLQTCYAGPLQRTPNLASIVQEIINREGWREGNAMAFIVSSSDSPNHRTAENGVSNGPILSIEYDIDSTTDDKAEMIIMQSAALDKPGSIRGGPYTHGPSTGKNNYTVFTINDDGTTITWQADFKALGYSQLDDTKHCECPDNICWSLNGSITAKSAD